MVWTRRRLLTNLGLAAATGGLALTGCSKSIVGAPLGSTPTNRRGATSTRPRPRETLNIAVVEGEPYAFKDSSGELTGATVKVVTAVLKKINYDVRLQTVEFSSIVPRVLSRQFDMAAGLYQTKNGCQNLTWSAIDHIGLTALAVPPGNPKGLKSFAEVISGNASVAVMTGLPEEQYATKAVAADKVVKFPSPIDMLQAVGAGRVDCAAWPDLSLKVLISSNIGGAGPLEMTTPFAMDGVDLPMSGYAFGTDADDELIDAFDDELVKMQKSGEWLDLTEPFGFTAQHLPKVGLASYCPR